MNEFQQQAVHNKEFLECVHKNYPSKFYDWKITITFYIAIHLLKALGKKRGVNIGSSHHEIFGNFDKSKTVKPITALPDDIWLAYKRIYQYSRSSRYDGISNIYIRDLSQMGDLAEVVKLQKQFCDYMETQHLKLT